MIIYAWQMLEGIKTDVLGLQMKLSKRTRHRRRYKKVQKGWDSNAGNYIYKNIKQSSKKDEKAVQLHTRISERYYWIYYRIF